ncbi:MAG: fused response regulator/thioredoxin-disulfide reductase, partial [Actinomycetota bacterium]|nr:fused response regulator/thioredoxin-disulfide reductase [Actinomycetota bacterium]
DWLPPEVGRYDRGFVLTDRDLPVHENPPRSGWPLDSPPLTLETGMPGVFAAGDARHRSMKRVAPAVGEGSVAANSVREYLNFGSRP